MMNPSLDQLETPTLLLDEARMMRNIERMRAQMQRLGVGFRPHVKTNKCLEVSRRLMTSATGPITVSTLLEADQFAAAGVKDILYAVCIAPNKLDHVLRLQAQGVRMSIILDSLEAAQAVIEKSRASAQPFEVLIEIDCDGHRSGVKPEAAELLEIGRLLQSAGLPPKGVMTHAGESYNCTGPKALQAMAEQERAAVVRAATRLRELGMACPVVSLGSTPTALSAENLQGVTEVRAGVYVFFDLVMAGIGVCAVDDIALSVLATVIGHQPEKGWTILDAGWMAMSRDRGTQKQPLDQGYGLVCDLQGQPLDDFILVGANQEHGIMASRSGRTSGLRHLPVGSQVRILPNHACPTAAAYDHYKVIDSQQRVSAHWPRFNGW
ncbi:MAG: DSD1 family PLP-dependent enzyme [Hylemonella sp.]